MTFFGVASNIFLNLLAFIDGHEADLYSIEWHPVKPHIFATACESSRLFVFDAQKRIVLKTCKVGFLGRACAWSSAPIQSEGSSSNALSALSLYDLA